MFTRREYHLYWNMSLTLWVDFLSTARSVLWFKIQYWSKSPRTVLFEFLHQKMQGRTIYREVLTFELQWILTLWSSLLQYLFICLLFVSLIYVFLLLFNSETDSCLHLTQCWHQSGMSFQWNIGSAVTKSKDK